MKGPAAHRPDGRRLPRSPRPPPARIRKSALETGEQPAIDGRDNLDTMALVEAAYLSAEEHRAVSLKEITKG